MLDLAVAVLADAGKLLEVAPGDTNLLPAIRHDFPRRLAGQVRELPLQIAHAGFAGEVADQVDQRLVRDRPLALLERMRLGLLRNQVALGDLDFLVLGVARDTNGLHPIEQGRRHPQRVGRGDEHHVREVVIDLQIVIVEGVVLLRVEHLQQGGGGVAPEIGAHLVDLVEEEERVRRLRLLHRLDDLARQRADIGAAVAADLGLVADAAEREAHEVAPRRARHRLAEGGLADSGRANQAEDRPLHLARPLLDREILEDPLLDLLQPVMVVVEDLLGVLEVLLDAGALLPRDRQHPVEVVADHRGFGRHGAHRAQLLDLGQRLLARLLGELRGLDARLELRRLVAPVLALAQLLLDRLHLFVQIVLALRLLHLTLDARADALLDLEHPDLAFHQRDHAFQPAADRADLQQFLLLAELDREVRGDRVRELARLLDLVHRDQHLRRHLLVELHVLLELARYRAAERLQLVGVALVLLHLLGPRLEERRIVLKLDDPRAGASLHQDLDGAVRQLEELEYRADHADGMDVLGRRLVLGGVLLRHEEDLLVVLHDGLERSDRLLAPDKERHDHVRKDDDVPERQDRVARYRRDVQHCSSCALRLRFRAVAGAAAPPQAR